MKNSTNKLRWRLTVQLWLPASIIIIFLQLTAIAGNAALQKGTILDTHDLKNIFVRMVTGDNSFNAVFPGQKQQVVNFSSQPEQIKLPPGSISYKTISQTRANQFGREIIWLAVLVNGQEQAKVKLSGDIHLFGDVVCVARNLERHTILTSDDVEIVRRNVTMLGPDFISDPQRVIGQELKTTLQPGAILYSRLLKNPAIVKRGDLVSILAKSGPLTVRAAGQVKTPGARGDIVQVKNLMSRRKIYARVIGPNEVQVDF